MKVLQINAVYGYGSTGRMVKEFDETFKQRQLESRVAVSLSNTPIESAYIMGSPLEHKTHALLSRLTGKQGYFSRFETKKLLTYLKEEKPDIVHLGNLHANYIHLPMLLKFLAKEDIATVLTLHDCFFYTGKCTHYIAEGCYKWQTGCHRCEKLKTDNVSWFFDQTASMWRDKNTLFSSIPRLAVIGVSDWITEEAKRSFLHTASIVRRIYNGIDMDVFAPTDQDVVRRSFGLPDRFTVLGVAQLWTENKGLHVFLELAAKRPDTQFVLVGDLMSDVRLPDNVLAVGVTDSEETLAAYYAAADVYLNPTLYETFGKTIAEALSCGTPVISNNTTAMPELIPQACGFVVDPVNDTDKIHEYLDVIEQRTKAAYSAECRRFAKENFDKTDCVEHYLQVYEDLLRL